MYPRWIAACVLLAAFGRHPAAAEPIIYTEQAVASGSLGGLGFTDTLVTLSLTADTTAVTSPSPGVFINLGQASLSIGGLAQANFDDPLVVFASIGPAGSVFGIADPALFEDVLDTGLPSGLFYDLTTALAPVTGTAYVSAFAPFATSGGDLEFFAAGPATFAATLQDVPEPASAGLFCGAALVLIGWRGRKPIH